MDTLPIAWGQIWGLRAWMKGPRLGNITGQFCAIVFKLDQADQAGWMDCPSRGSGLGNYGVKRLNWTIVPTLTMQNTQLRGWTKYGCKGQGRNIFSPILFNYFPTSNPMLDLSHGQMAFSKTHG